MDCNLDGITHFMLRGSTTINFLEDCTLTNVHSDDAYKAIFPMKERAGISRGDGLLVEGDPKSIDKVRKALHDSEVVLPSVRTALSHESAEFKKFMLAVASAARIDHAEDLPAAVRKRFDDLRLTEIAARNVVREVGKALDVPELGDVILYAKITAKNLLKAQDEIGKLQQRIAVLEENERAVRQSVGASVGENLWYAVKMLVKERDEQRGAAIKARAELVDERKRVQSLKESNTRMFSTIKAKDDRYAGKCLEVNALTAEVAKQKSRADHFKALNYGFAYGMVSQDAVEEALTVTGLQKYGLRTSRTSSSVS